VFPSLFSEPFAASPDGQAEKNVQNVHCGLIFSLVLRENKNIYFKKKVFCFSLQKSERGHLSKLQHLIVIFTIFCPVKLQEIPGY